MATNAPHFKSRQMTEWNECKIYVIGRSTHQLQYAYWQQKVSCRTRSHDIFCSTKNVLSQTINTTIFGRRLFRWRFDFRVRRKMKTENLFIYFFSLIVQTFHCVVLFVYSSFVRVLFFFSSSRSSISITNASRLTNVWNALNMNSPISFLFFSFSLFFYSIFLCPETSNGFFYSSSSRQFACVVFVWYSLRSASRLVLQWKNLFVFFIDVWLFMFFFSVPFRCSIDTSKCARFERKKENRIIARLPN